MKPLFEMIKRHEENGEPQLHFYRDQHGNWTSGFGFLLTDWIFKGGLDEAEKRGIDTNSCIQLSEEFIEICFEKCVQWFIDSAYKAFPNIDKESPRMDAIIDIMYQRGPAGFTEKWPNATAYLRNNDFENAANEIITTKWAKEFHSRATELIFMIRNNRYMTLEEIDNI